MEKVKEMLVNSILTPTIYLTKAKPMKDNPGCVERVGNKKIDMTDNAINCVYQWFKQKVEDKDNPAKNNYSIKYKNEKYTLWMLPTDVYKKLLENYDDIQELFSRKEK